MLAEPTASWVLLHGMLGAPSMFEPLLAELARCAPRPRGIVAPVLPGHGRQPCGLAATSFDQALAELAARLPSGPLCVAGYSLGARLAVALASREPWRFRCVVAVGAHLGIETPSELAERRAWDLRMAALVRERGMSALVDAWQRLDLFATQVDLPAEIARLQRQVRLAHVPQGIAWAFEVLGTGSMPPLRARLPAPGVAISWVAGALDEKFSAMARSAAAQGWGRALVVPGAGHNVALEAPRALAELLAESFDAARDERHPGSSTRDKQGAS